MSSRPSQGELCERDLSAPARTVQTAWGSTTQRSATAPAATEGTSSPAMRAGAALIRVTSVPSGSSPDVTSAPYSTLKAVSRPTTPKGASSKGTSLLFGACGAWSVATQSTSPLLSASTRALRSFSARSGGFILKLVSNEASSRRSSVRWCGVVSAVTRTPASLARAIACSDSSALTWQTCTRASS